MFGIGQILCIFSLAMGIRASIFRESNRNVVFRLHSVINYLIDDDCRYFFC